MFKELKDKIQNFGKRLETIKITSDNFSTEKYNN